MNILKPLRSRKWLLIGLLVLLGPTLYFTLKAPAQKTLTPPPASQGTIPEAKEQVRPELSVRLKVPKINTDAVIEQVGLTAEGDMDTPKAAKEVAWYKLGPRPGENGSAVITGHFGLKNNVPGAFDNLDKLRPGDIVYAEDAKGAVMTFVVSKTQKYGPEDDATAVFRSNDGKAHLNLITCDGTWNRAKKSYSHRLVVFTDKKDS